MREFLAIPLPEPLRLRAAAARAVLTAQDGGWRFAREEGLHVTIRFLGEVDPARHDDLNAAWREAARGTGVLRLRLEGAAVLPTPKKPRLFCLRVRDESGDGSLGRLAERVERAARARGFPHEDRAFAPHVTLARARRGARVLAPAVERGGDCGTFVAERLVLYRSEPDRGGSRYIEEASYPLTPEGA